MADVVSPWSIGRFRTVEDASNKAQPLWAKDIQWCKQHNLDFLPVLFPGFSWFNMHGNNWNSIPRLKGEFYWSMFLAAKRAGAQMAYVAMFDEFDESTNILKCTNDPPVGESEFLTYDQGDYRTVTPFFPAVEADAIHRGPSETVIHGEVQVHNGTGAVVCIHPTVAHAVATGPRCTI